MQNSQTAHNTDQHAGMQSRHRLLERYQGASSTIRVDRWLNLFEVVALQEPNDKAKLTLLMLYLSGEALDWYATDICPDITTLTWASVKERMTERFGTPVIHPLIEAQHRHLKGNEDVQTYYNEKVRLLRQAEIRDDAAVAQLTQGMPLTYRPALTSARLRTPQEWLAMAKQLEPILRVSTTPRRGPRFAIDNGASVMQNQCAAVNANSPPSTSGTVHHNRGRPPTRPPAPCRFCKQDGQLLWHWHSECPRRPTVQSSQYPRAYTPHQAPHQSPSQLETHSISHRTAIVTDNAPEPLASNSGMHVLN